MKKGIELEYWVVDRQGRLDEAEKISQNFEFSYPEFVKPLLEIRTEPYEDIEKIREEMFERVRKCIEEAHRQDLRIVPTGTPLNSGPIDVIPGSERVKLEQSFFPEHNVKDRTRAGTHIHFEQENVVRQLNLVTALDPASAVLNSSPYHDGTKLASSSRNYFYRHLWDCKFPENIGLWEYTDSVEEWRQRLEDRFQDLRRSAIENDVDPEDFEANYSPEDSVWIPVRLRQEFGTVEWRSGDAAIPSEVFKLLEEISGLVESSSSKEVLINGSSRVNESITLPEFSELSRISREAIEDGLHSSKVVDHLEGLGINTDRFDPLTDHIERDGEEISLEEAREIRLEAAEILEEDVLN
jgi:gamma-glutamyl:cysteine ligase YbdK (ATP-grasp superfamily)